MGDLYLGNEYDDEDNSQNEYDDEEPTKSMFQKSFQNWRAKKSDNEVYAAQGDSVSLPENLPDVPEGKWGKLGKVYDGYKGVNFVKGILTSPFSVATSLIKVADDIRSGHGRHFLPEFMTWEKHAGGADTDSKNKLVEILNKYGLNESNYQEVLNDMSSENISQKIQKMDPASIDNFKQELQMFVESENPKIGGRRFRKSTRKKSKITRKIRTTNRKRRTTRRK